MAEAPFEHETTQAQRLRHVAKQYFVTGLLVIVPAVVTLWVFGAVLGFVDSLFAGLPPDLRPRSWIPVPGISLLLFIALILLVGMAASNSAGRYVHRLGDRLLSSIPLFRGVYLAVKQTLETIFAAQGQTFRRVVLIQYPRKGLYTLAFVSAQARGEIARATGKPDATLLVFVPTTPNPTSGFLLAVPEEEVISLAISVEDAFKLVVSGGIVSPDDSATRRKE